MTRTWIAATAAIMTVLGSRPAPAGNIVNADMTFTTSQVLDTGDDYFFNDNASSTWQINNGAAGAPYHSREETPWRDHLEGFTTQNAVVFFHVHGKRLRMEVVNPVTLEVIDSLETFQ